MMLACEGRLVSGEERLLAREATGLVIAAMTLPNVLDRLFDGAVVVAAGDRPEVVLGVLTAHVSANFPQMSGIVLNGGIPLAPQVGRLIEGMQTTMPIIETDFGTKDTATALSALRGRLDKDSPRKVATALALFDEYVDGDALLDRLEVARSDAVTPLMFEHQLLDLAVAERRHIVLPEGDDDRVLQAADIVLRRKIADLTILGDPRAVQARAAMLGVDLAGARLVSPFDGELRERFGAEYHAAAPAQGSRPRARARPHAGRVVLRDDDGRARVGRRHGLGRGPHHRPHDPARARGRPDRSRRLGGVLGVLHVPAPPGTGVRRLRRQSRPDRLPARRHRARLGPDGRRRSASTRAWRCCPTRPEAPAPGATCEKVVEATAMVRERAPDLPIEGPIQYDAAIDATVARTKLPDSKVAGHATVFVFPDLNTGNNTYKAVQRSAGALAVGPILQGLRKPVNDLSRGATVRDIVNTIAITAIQAQGRS